MIMMDIKTALTIVIAMAKRATPAKDRIAKAGEEIALKVVQAHRKAVKVDE